MKAIILTAWIIILLVFIPFEVLASSKKTKKDSKMNQDTFKLDLVLYEENTTKTFYGNKSYDLIILKNAVRGFKYDIEIQHEVGLLPSLPIVPSLVYTLTDTKDNDCKELENKIGTLANFQTSNSLKRTEKELAKLIRQLENELKVTKCKDENLKKTAEKWIKTATQKVEQKIHVKTGETITLTVKRDEIKWIFIFKGKGLGTWVTSYGFGFMGVDKDNYYTKQVPDTSLYKVLKAHKPKALDLKHVPAVFFSYFPSQNFNTMLNQSLTGGLGFDLSAPVVFLGYNVLFRNNIGASIGVAFQEQYSLKNQYSENDIVSGGIPTENLHDKIYRPKIFFAVHFRFGENPFKNRQTNTKE